MQDTDTELQKLLNDYMRNHPNSESQLAGEILVSVPTIQRWSRGKNLPRSAVAKSVIAYLKSQLRTG